MAAPRPKSREMRLHIQFISQRPLQRRALVPQDFLPSLAAPVARSQDTSGSCQTKLALYPMQSHLLPPHLSPL